MSISFLQQGPSNDEIGPNHSPDESTLLRDEARKSEIVIDAAHVAMGVVLAVITVIMWRGLTTTIQRANLAASILFVVYGGVILAVQRGTTVPWISFVTISIDIAVLSIVLWLAGSERSIKSPGFLGYFLVVAAAAFRYDTKHTIYAGIISLLCFVGLFAASTTTGRVSVGTMTEAFTSASVSASVLLQRSVYFAIFVGLTVVSTDSFGCGYFGTTVTAGSQRASG